MDHWHLDNLTITHISEGTFEGHGNLGDKEI